MPISQLEKHPALVVIDMQKGILRLPTVQPAEAITANNAKLARAFRAHRHAIEKIFPRLGETTTTEIVLGLLKKQG